MTPQETAMRVTTGILGGIDMPFSRFRERMIDEHPDPLDDTAIWDLYQEYVVRRQNMPADQRILDTLATLTRQSETSMEEARKRVAERAAQHEASVAEAKKAVAAMHTPRRGNKRRNKKKKWWQR